MKELCAVLLAAAIALPRSTGFVSLPSQWSILPNQAVGYGLFATSNATITTATTNTNNNALKVADPTVEAPLPPSYTDCPFTGIMAGPKSFYRQASEALQAPQVFSFLDRHQRPMVEVRGGKVVREVLRQEFTSLSSNALAGISQKICGPNSLRTAHDRDSHQVLRQLVGVPLSAKAVEKSIPRLEAIGRARIKERLNSGEDIIVAWDMTQAMALDVVWQQILGLDLETPQEIATFHQKTHTWLKGMWYKGDSPEFAATMKAKEYLRTAIDKKINQLLKEGKSDGSTVAGLLFATMADVESNASASTPHDRTLTREEIIDNCLLLILAGTETTATNVANALLIMGLHPHVWQRVKDEQKAIIAEHGDPLTPEVLQHCTYLDAVLHEMMRVLPVTLVSRKVAEETMVVDGMQIPKGWFVSYNMYLTHQHDPVFAEEEDHMDLIKGFKPERWLQKTTRSKDYIPFGAGPRQCPGSFLAMTEMKAFVSLLARKMSQFELVGIQDFDPNMPIDEQIQWNLVSSLITPEDGVRIRILPTQQ